MSHSLWPIDIHPIFPMPRLHQIIKLTLKSEILFNMISTQLFQQIDSLFMLQLQLSQFYIIANSLISSMFPPKYSMDKRLQGSSLQMSRQKKLTALISHPQKHRCDRCWTPLQKFTKVITMKHPQLEDISSQDQKIRLLCVSCFAGWSSQKIDPSQVERQIYRYYVCKRIDVPLEELDGWSIQESLQLLSCAQKFGPQVNSVFQAQFVSKTGKNISVDVLQQKYDKFKQILFNSSQYNYQFKHDQQNQTSYLEKPIPQPTRKIVESLNLNTEQQIQTAEQFLSMLNYEHPIDHFRRTPDNHGDYIARMLATNQITRQKTCSNQHLGGRVSYEQNNRLHLTLFKCLNERDSVNKKHHMLNAKYCQMYIKTRGRTKIVLNKEDQTLKTLYQLSHPQISNLLMDDEIKTQLTKVVELHQRRQQFFQQIKDKQKHSFSGRSSRSKSKNKNIQQVEASQSQKKEYSLNAEQEQGSAHIQQQSQIISQ